MTSRYVFTLGLLGSGLAMAALGQIGCGSSSNGSGTTTGTGGSGGKATTHTVAASSSGVTTGGGGSPGAANLGLACATDTDCGGAPLKCILPTANDAIFGGGPANGYCSQTCMSDTDCPSTGACLVATAGGMGDCVENCTIGPALTSVNEPLDPTKCQGRTDLRCAPIDQEGTVFGCLPTCGEDSQCPTGEACDPRAAVCVPSGSVSTGQPAGTACDPNATTPVCAGICVSFTGSADGGAPITLCSDECTLGGDVTTTANCGGLAKGLCAYSPQGNGAGDYGFCANGCSAQTDCQNPNFWCFPITNLTGTGKGEVPNGWCFGATACPNGANDCSMDPGTVCTQTGAGGPLCLSTTYPLAGDGGTPDSGTPDSGTPDAGTPDSGTTDDGGDDGGDGGDAG